MGAKHLPTDSKVNLDYISIPVMLQYNVLPNLYLEAGPQFNFLVNSKIKFPSNSIDGKDAFKTFDFGLGLGAGYYFIPNIGVNVRYVAGLTNIGKDRPGASSSTKNGALQIGLSYKF